MTDLSAEHPAQEQVVHHTPLSAEILNPPKNLLAAKKVQATVTGSILGIDVAKQINQAGVNGTITPEEKTFLETELGAANCDLWSALDRRKIPSPSVWEKKNGCDLCKKQ